MKNSKSVRQAFLITLLGVLTSISVSAVGQEENAGSQQTFTGQSFAFYALSRGQGVPEPARQALQQLRDMLAELRAEEKVTRIEEQRIGLEGEIRLCAEFATAGAAFQAWQQAQEVIENIELVDLKSESCNNR